MPLLDSDFDRKFLEVNTDEKIAQGLDLLKQRDGHDDWHLILHQGAQWYAVQVTDLKKWFVKVGPSLFEMTVGDLMPVFEEVGSARQDRIGIGTAEDWAQECKGKLLLVMQGEQPVGRIYVGAVRGNDLFIASSMAQLYGDYITVAADRRSAWVPTGVEVPICPKCQYQGWYRFSLENGSFECTGCGHTVEE